MRHGSPGKELRTTQQQPVPHTPSQLLFLLITAHTGLSQNHLWASLTIQFWDWQPMPFL